MSGRIRDIEGLRAVAVLSVLLFHAELGFPGGYVGVDVFFVVSGFLITGLLVAEHEMTGGVSLAGFWARRARRLLPAASVVLVATMLASLAVLDPLARRRLAGDAANAAGFVANFRFAGDGNGYFDLDRAPSVLQHWWSLAVEEQFYVAWPVALVILWKWRPGRRTLTWFSGAVVVLSLAVSVRLVDAGSVWGYYGLHSRAWEMAIGGLLAGVLPVLGPAGRGRAVIGWAGLVGIAASMFLYDGGTDFPGVAATLPVFGTVGVLLAIGATWGPGRVLSAGVLQWIGGRSYSLYLWHWPLLILAAARWEENPVQVRGGALMLAVVLAAASYRWVENPVRHARMFVSRSRASLLLGGAMVAASVACAGGLRLASGDQSTGYVADTVPAVTSTITSSTVPPTTETVMAEYRSMIASTLAPAIESSLGQRLAPDNLRPSISGAPDDKVAIFSDQCMASFKRTSNPPCEFGDVGADTKVVLFGDSHAAQWFTPLDIAARDEGVALLAWTKMGCPAVSLSVRRDAKRDYPECDVWREGTLKRIATSDARLVILSNYAYHPKGKPKGRFSNAEWAEGLAATIRTIQASGKKVLVLSDSPVPGTNMPECLAANTRRVDRCTRSRSLSVNEARITRERATTEDLGALYVETTDLACATACPAIIGNMVTYLDSNHLTSTYAGSLSPYFRLLLRAGLLQ